MEKIVLGRTGLKVSPLCIGTWQLGGPVSFGGKPGGHPDPGKENVVRLIRGLGDRGINFIDTAEQYGKGGSERRVGEALKGRRDQWVISTKFGYRVGPDGEREDDSSPSTILRSLHGSVRRLQTDYIDIYLFHCPPRVEDLETAKEVLEKAREEGKIRYYGISTSNFDLIQQLDTRNMLEVLQYPVNLLVPRSEVHDFVAIRNVGVQVRGVMAQGRLSGKYFHRTPTWKQDDNRSVYFKGELFESYAMFQKAVPEGLTMAQVAIRWALDQPGHHSICLGAKSFEDYASAIEAAEMPPLDSKTLQVLRDCVTEIHQQTSSS